MNFVISILGRVRKFCFTTEKMISEAQWIGMLESLRNLVILGRRYRHLSFNSLYFLHSLINHLTKPHDQFFVRVCSRDVSRNGRWAVIWCQSATRFRKRGLQIQHSTKIPTMGCTWAYDPLSGLFVRGHKSLPYFAKQAMSSNLMSEGVRCGLDKEKARMGYTWRISHSGFGLRGRRWLLITSN